MSSVEGDLYVYPASDEYPQPAGAAAGMLAAAVELVRFPPQRLL